MVAAPRLGECLRKVCFKKKPEIFSAFLPSGRVLDFRDFPDVAAGGAGFGCPLPGGFFDFVVCSRRGDPLIAGLYFIENPGGLPETVYRLSFRIGGDPETCLAQIAACLIRSHDGSEVVERI